MLACVWASIRRRGHSVTSIMKRMNLIHAYFRCKQERRPFPKILTFKTRSMQNRTCRHWVLLTVRITRIFCTHPRLEKRQLELSFRHRACRTLVSTVLYPFLIHFLLEIREINWNRYASRNCFWDGYQGTAYQLLAIFSLTLTTVPGIFAKVYSSFLFAS